MPSPPIRPDPTQPAADRPPHRAATPDRPPASSALVDAVRAVGLVKVYGAGAAAVTALDRVTVGFEAGRFTAIMGPSGSGKSTLLHCLAGIDSVDAGQVLLGGTDLTAWATRAGPGCAATPSDWCSRRSTCCPP